jgi:hypothetical protein
MEELLLMVRSPVAEPVAIGSNCTLTVTAWPGFSVAGKAGPDTEKPVPVTETALTATAAVPEEVSVTD